MALRRLYNASGQAINPATYEAQIPGEYPCSVHLVRLLDSTTLAAPAAKGDRTITVSSPAGYVIGSRLSVLDSIDTENDLFRVMNVVGSVLTLDRRLDANHLAGETVRRVTPSMISAVGTPDSPMLYEFKPQLGVWRITNMHIMMGSAGEPSLDKFGGIAALTNGVHIKKCNQSGRDYTFAIPFRSNASFDLSGGDYQKEDKVGTTYWCHFGFIFNSLFGSEFIIDTQSSICAAVQDDLSGLASCEIKVGLRRID